MSSAEKLTVTPSSWGAPLPLTMELPPVLPCGFKVLIVPARSAISLRDWVGSSRACCMRLATSALRSLG